ncbi:unnamed protein product, partial [Staurois parvus]
ALVGTGGWHWWAQVGGTGGWAQVGGTAGHRWVGTGGWHCWAQVGALLGTGGWHCWAQVGGTCVLHCWAPIIRALMITGNRLSVEGTCTLIIRALMISVP